MTNAPQATSSPLRRLQGLARPRPPQERCELCGVVIPPEHHHLLELAARKLVCACEACAILFARDDTLRYRRVPRRVRLLDDLPLSDELWESLPVPINLAFFYYDGGAGRVVAMYPSPAGATESLLTMDSWIELSEASATLRGMQPDVEALLVNRARGARRQWLVPIDDCYRLVAVIRTRWRGFTGGKEVWAEIDEFFEELGRRAKPYREPEAAPEPQLTAAAPEPQFERS
jgi:hypothetical protein